MNACYSESDALNHVGARVVTVTDLPEVPAGTHGRVVRTGRSAARGWTLRIRWDLPPKRTVIFAQLGDFSFNLPWRARRATAEFSRSEVEQFLRPLETE